MPLFLASRKQEYEKEYKKKKQSIIDVSVINGACNQLFFFILIYFNFFIFQIRAEDRYIVSVERNVTGNITAAQLFAAVF